MKTLNIELAREIEKILKKKVEEASLEELKWAEGFIDGVKEGKQQATSDILEMIDERESFYKIHDRFGFNSLGNIKCRKVILNVLVELKQKITNQQESPRGYDVLPNGVSELCSHSADIEPEDGVKIPKDTSGSLFDDICDNCIHNEVCYDIVEFGERQGECGSFISKQKIQGVKGE